MLTEEDKRRVIEEENLREEVRKKKKSEQQSKTAVTCLVLIGLVVAVAVFGSKDSDKYFSRSSSSSSITSIVQTQEKSLQDVINASPVKFIEYTYGLPQDSIKSLRVLVAKGTSEEDFIKTLKYFHLVFKSGLLQKVMVNPRISSIEFYDDKTAYLNPKVNLETGDQNLYCKYIKAIYVYTLHLDPIPSTDIGEIGDTSCSNKAFKKVILD